MTKPDASTLLKQRIARLEQQQKHDEMVMYNHFYKTLEQLQPLNIIKSIGTGIFRSLKLPQDILSSFLMATVGFVANRFFTRWENTSLKQVIADFMQTLATASITGRFHSFIEQIISRMQRAKNKEDYLEEE